MGWFIVKRDYVFCERDGFRSGVRVKVTCRELDHVLVIEYVYTHTHKYSTSQVNFTIDQVS